MPAEHVKWALWNDFTERYFNVASYFSITMYYAFLLYRSTPGKLFAREFSFYTDEKVFSIVWNEVFLDTIRRETGLVFTDVKCGAFVTPHREVKSAQQGTGHR